MIFQKNPLKIVIFKNGPILKSHDQPCPASFGKTVSSVILLKLQTEPDNMETSVIGCPFFCHETVIQGLVNHHTNSFVRDAF